MATIQWRKHRRKDGKITKTATLNWSEGGKQCRVSLGNVSAKDAEDVRLSKQLELRTGAQIFSHAPLFHEMAEEYLRWRAMEYPDSQERVEQIFTDHLIPAFRYVALDQLKSLQVERFKGDRLALVSEETVKKEIRQLKAMMRKAVEWELIKFDPIASVQPPRSRTSKPMHWYSMEQLQTIYDNSKHRHIWQLMANTGLRRSEAQQLEDKHDKGESIIVLSEPGARTKSRKWREIPLSRNARESIDSMKNHTGFMLPVMTAPSLSRAFRNDLPGGLDGSLHSLRHTFGTTLAIKGTPVRVIKELMGHSTIRTTEQYLHVAQDHLKQAIQGFNI